MKRFLTAFVLGAFLLAGWTIAQPPPGDTQEPPVRLKKKKKNQPEKPNPPAEVKPEKPPEPKPKPKLGEDAELDPRDDVKLPRGEEETEADIMQRLNRNARLSAEKLAKRDAGEGTRKTQEEILKDLDRLLQQSKQDQQNQQQGQQGQDSKGDPQGGDSGAEQKGGGQTKEQRAQQRAQQRKQKSGGRQSAQGSQGSGQGKEPKPGQGTTPGGGGGDSQARKDPKDPDKKFDLWGHLPEKERALMNKEMEQKFMEKYDDLTKQYYRTIAEKSRRK